MTKGRAIPNTVALNYKADKNNLLPAFHYKSESRLLLADHKCNGLCMVRFYGSPMLSPGCPLRCFFQHVDHIFFEPLTIGCYCPEVAKVAFLVYDKANHYRIFSCRETRPGLGFHNRL